LQALGEKEGNRERLREAAEAYRAALAEWTRESAPFEWTKAQKHLADALAVMGIEESDGGRLIEAVNAYRQVLDGVSRAVVPLD
jgi:hypothetical protein